MPLMYYSLLFRLFGMYVHICVCMYIYIYIGAIALSYPPSPFFIDDSGAEFHAY